jgi:hypothetical protein
MTRRGFDQEFKLQLKKNIPKSLYIDSDLNERLPSTPHPILNSDHYMKLKNRFLEMNVFLVRRLPFDEAGIDDDADGKSFIILQLIIEKIFLQNIPMFYYIKNRALRRIFKDFPDHPKNPDLQNNESANNSTGEKGENKKESETIVNNTNVINGETRITS